MNLPRPIAPHMAAWSTFRPETDLVRAEHHHDWSGATRTARGTMFSTTQDPFTSANDYSYLRLLNKATGAELFVRPVPALTHIWISPDSKYVVGLSKVMLWNPTSNRLTLPVLSPSRFRKHDHLTKLVSKVF